MDQQVDDGTTGRIIISTTQARGAERRGVLRVLVYSTLLVVVGFILVFFLYFR
jgi:hypothetical protein